MKQWLSMLILFSLMFVTPQTIVATTGRIDINATSLHKMPTRDNTYVINMNLHYQLNDYLINGLKNGITLKNKINFYLKRKRNWWWDYSKKIKQLEITLRYHALSRHYQLIRLDSNEHWNFSNLASALKKMGKLNSLILPKLPSYTQTKTKTYYISARASLMPQHLKLPLKIQSLFDSEYKLKSREVTWLLP